MFSIFVIFIEGKIRAMADKTLDKRLLSYFHSLGRPEKMNVLKYLKSLVKKDFSSNTELLKLAGTISVEDLELMENAIKEGCEKIDKDEW